MNLGYIILDPSPVIQWQDSLTGVYMDIDGTLYLNNGTPIDDYDQNTGAYYEGGSWYTFQGVPLSQYDKTTGNYQEQDGTWYTKDGKAIATGVTNPAKALTKTAAGVSSSTWIYLIVGAAALLFILSKK
jgi:hypothetical protein